MSLRAVLIRSGNFKIIMSLAFSIHGSMIGVSKTWLAYTLYTPLLINYCRFIIVFHAQLAGKQWTQARVENVSFYDLDLDFTAPRKAFGRGPADVGTETLSVV